MNINFGVKAAFFSTLIILLLPFTMSGQAPTVVVRYDNSSVYTSGFSKVRATSDGGFLATGSSGLLGWVTKFDSNLNVLWTFSIDSIPMRDAVETNDGNYVILGLSYRTDYPNNPLYILKTTPAGVVIFQKRYYDGTLNNALTAEGVCKAAGTDQGFVFYGGNCIASQYAIKCDVNGVVQWEKNNLGMGPGFISTMVPDGNGYVGSFSYLYNSMGHPGIIRLDANGLVTAVKTFQTAASIQLYSGSLVKLNSGGFAVISSPNDIYGVTIITVDAAFGNVTCNRIVSSAQLYLSGNFATMNASDEIVVLGGAGIGYAAAIQVNPFTGVISAMKNNSSGLGQADQGLALPNGNFLICGAVNNDPMFAVLAPGLTGFCASQNLGLTTQSNYAYTPGTPAITAYPINAAVANVNYVLNTQTLITTILCGGLIGIDEANEEGAVMISPNPATEHVFIRSDLGNITEVCATDMEGRVAFRSEMINAKETKIDLSSLSAGMYMITVTTENGSFVRKIIRQ